MYLELELPTYDGGEIPVQVQMELNWFMLEELGERSITLKVEQLTNFVYLKTPIILLKQQDSQDRVNYGVLSMNLVEFYIQVWQITMYHVLSATFLPGRQYS